jgi:hypothetical protein
MTTPLTDEQKKSIANELKTTKDTKSVATKFKVKVAQVKAVLFWMKKKAY